MTTRQKVEAATFESALRRGNPIITLQVTHLTSYESKNVDFSISGWKFHEVHEKFTPRYSTGTPDSKKLNRARWTQFEF